MVAVAAFRRCSDCARTHYGDKTFETAMFAFRFIGICFVFNGVMDMWGTYSFNKFVKDTKDDYVIEAKTEDKNGENK